MSIINITFKLAVRTTTGNWIMNRVIIIIGIFFLLNGVANAECSSDFNCKYGDKCVKASGDINITGVCVTPSDRFGNPSYKYSTPRSSPQNVRNCSFDTDCSIGFSCMKRSGQIYGICVK